jgi:hypothetical protein
VRRLALFTAGDLQAAGLDLQGTGVAPTRVEQVDDDGQVHFVAVPADDPAAARLLARSA